MDEISADGSLRHDVPAPLAMRVILIGLGAFVICIATLELWQGVRPPNLFSPFFGFILFGALSVGGGVATIGLFGPSRSFTIRPGRIDIENANLFRRWTVSLTPGAVADLSVRENDSGDGPSTFSVVITSAAGPRYESRSLGSRTAAEALRQRILAAFEGSTSP